MQTRSALRSAWSVQSPRGSYQPERMACISGRTVAQADRCPQQSGNSADCDQPARTAEGPVTFLLSMAEPPERACRAVPRSRYRLMGHDEGLARRSPRDSNSLRRERRSVTPLILPGQAAPPALGCSGKGKKSISLPTQRPAPFRVPLLANGPDGLGTQAGRNGAGSQRTR